MHLNRTLFEARKAALGLTNSELARRLGVHRTTVQRWAGGQKLPGRDALFALAHELDIPVTQLALRDEE